MIRMRPSAPAVLVSFLLLVFTGASAAEVDGARLASLCASLERGNIDCECVGRRTAAISRAVTGGAADAVLEEGYREALGQDNSYLQALETLHRDLPGYLRIEEALSVFGGRPETVVEYEESCVIKGAGPAPLPSWPREWATTAYFEQCVRASGISRYCECEVARTRGRLSPEAFEAYYRSFSDYSDKSATTLEDMSRARANAMGLSAESYATLTTDARQVTDRYAEQDEAYCHAMIWADNEEGLDAASRAVVVTPAAGTAEDLSPATPASTAAEAASMPPSRYQRALAMLGTACAADGNSTGYCDCYLADIEKNIFPRLDSEAVSLAYALMQGGSGMEPMEMMSLMSSLSSQDQMAAAMVAGGAAVGESCSQ